MPTDVLHCLFTGTVEGGEDALRIRLPDAAVEGEAVAAGDAVRIGLYDGSSGRSASGDTAGEGDTAAMDPPGDVVSGAREPPEAAPAAPQPPVEAGEIRYVEIEDVGKRGDGIANVDRGYVIIVPDTEPGDRVKIEIGEVTADYAMATMIDGPA